jgi:hypothetical protein
MESFCPLALRCLARTRISPWSGQSIWKLIEPSDGKAHGSTVMPSPDSLGPLAVLPLRLHGTVQISFPPASSTLDGRKHRQSEYPNRWHDGTCL